MDNYGVVKLIDFNVAQQLEAQTTKTVVGKHSYIPPEQFRGKAVPQSDIYSLGATLSYLLTGKDPEPITQAHPRETNGAVSEELDSIIAKSTALGLSTRYQTCQELKTDLISLLSPQAADTE
jgi:serine/threonine protein kinase